MLAKRNGARLVIINREATEFDAIADLVLPGDIGTLLAEVVGPDRS
jgi:NAD-dependent deacetylase